jgi:hypothetical protein
VSIRYALMSKTVGNESVDNNLLPLSILEELKDSETLINAIIDYQVLEQLRLASKEHE